jgi:uroporphyrinogen decarboxylase
VDEHGKCEEFFKPYQMMVANEIKKPWIFHSDGNPFSDPDGLAQLGMNGDSPGGSPSRWTSTPAEWRVTALIVGNIDLDYTLPRGTEAEVEAEVRDRIETVGKGGGYMISSANSITDYCKVENVRAMSRAIRKYGKYA